MSLQTARLELRPATPTDLEAALAGAAALTSALGAEVPASWPPEFLDDRAFRFTLDRLRTHPDERRWWMYFLLLQREGNRPLLVGGAGYKGPPAPDGTVEIGYGIVADERRRGLATEATAALVEAAFRDPTVTRVIAETLPELVGSIGVLHRAGFHPVDDASEPGVLRFARHPPSAARGLGDHEFRALLFRLADAWRRRDYAAAAACFAPDVRYADPLRYGFTGRADLQRFFENDDGLPQRTEWHLVLFDPARQVGVAEYSYDGTHRYHGAALVRLSGGLITHWREYQHVDARAWPDFTAATAGLG